MKTFKELREKCWDGYHQQGLKKKGNKMVPNCVPVKENFMDNKNPQDKGDMARHGLKGKTISQLKKIRSSSTASKREKQLAHWRINMTQGRKKANEESLLELNRIARKPDQPAKSKLHSDLYTDEEPKGTIHGLKFATVNDAKSSVNKIKNSSRSHAHKIQAAVAMEQRAKAAGKLEAAATYRRFINSIKKTNEQNSLEEEINENIKKVIAATVLATAAATSPHSHAQEPSQHPSNPHLIAHVEHENKVHRFDLERMFKSREHAAEHMTSALKKHGMANHILHITHKNPEDKSPSYSVKHSTYMEKEPYTHKGTNKDYSDNKPYTPKHTDKDYFSPAK